MNLKLHHNDEKLYEEMTIVCAGTPYLYAIFKVVDSAINSFEKKKKLNVKN